MGYRTQGAGCRVQDAGARRVSNAEGTRRIVRKHDCALPAQYTKHSNARGNSFGLGHSQLCGGLQVTSCLAQAVPLDFSVITASALLFGKACIGTEPISFLAPPCVRDTCTCGVGTCFSSCDPVQAHEGCRIGPQTRSKKIKIPETSGINVLYPHVGVCRSFRIVFHSASCLWSYSTAFTCVQAQVSMLEFAEFKWALLSNFITHRASYVTLCRASPMNQMPFRAFCA